MKAALGLKIGDWSNLQSLIFGLKNLSGKVFKGEVVFDKQGNFFPFNFVRLGRWSESSAHVVHDVPTGRAGMGVGQVSLILHDAAVVAG
jgi:hypothetical protein